ncbi:hypothetical protein [Rubrivirga sp.]|uniref:hypothetical protein n=1 Tax=Rubrivirga sp. TaxID=1885344 RepID=UPI003C722FE0
MPRFIPAAALAAALTLSACSGPGASTSDASSIAACQGSSSRTTVAVADLPPPPPPAPPQTEPSYSSVRGQNAALDAAAGAYNEARFEDAATQFDAVADAPGSNAQVKRVALRMLGRTRLALGDRDGAADALRRLVENEPPMVRLDPDVEPLALLEAFYQVRRDVDGDYAVRTDRDRTLAIADFTNGSITDFDAVDPLRLGFASLMIDRMRGSTELELVERVRLQWLLDEQNLAATQEGGRQAGRLLGADQVVFGTYIKNGDDMLLTARVVDVETGRILMGERVEGRASQFDALVSCLSELVAESVDARLPAAPTAQTAPESLDAVIAYARGLALEETEDFAAAAEQYQLALSLDPSYEPAQLRMDEGVVPMMAANN